MYELNGEPILGFSGLEMHTPAPPMILLRREQKDLLLRPDPIYTLVFNYGQGKRRVERTDHVVVDLADGRCEIIDGNLTITRKAP